MPLERSRAGRGLHVQDMNFRLLRYDMVHEMTETVQSFRARGGVGWLQQQDRTKQVGQSLGDVMRTAVWDAPFRADGVPPTAISQGTLCDLPTARERAYSCSTTVAQCSTVVSCKWMCILNCTALRMRIASGYR
jgi:hypothetical protein